MFKQRSLKAFHIVYNFFFRFRNVQTKQPRHHRTETKEKASVRLVHKWYSQLSEDDADADDHFYDAAVAAAAADFFIVRGDQFQLVLNRYYCYCRRIVEAQLQEPCEE